MSKISFRGLITILAYIFYFPSLSAQNYVFAQLQGSPVNTTGWSLYGAAQVGNITSLDNSEVIICPNVPESTGAIFYDQPINLSVCNHWAAEFDFRIYDGTRADGIAFCFLDVPPSSYAPGGGLGIPETANGLKVCFDQYPNCEPFSFDNYPKIEIRYGIGYEECRDQPTVDNASGNLSYMRSNSYNRAKITYNGGNISVYVNDTLYLTGFQQFDFPGYIGFCSGTGSESDNHSIKNVIIYTDIPPSVAGSSDSATLCSGESLQLGTSASPEYVYAWSPSIGLDASNISGPTLSLENNTDDLMVQKYYVKTSLSTSPGCTSTDSITVTVNAKPSVLITASATDICEGNGVTFNATAVHGGAAPLYQWQKNGINVGSNATSYTDNTLKNGDSIACVLKAAISCSGIPFVTSNSIVMTVSPVVTPAITITSSANNICTGTDVSFKAVGTNEGSDPVYQWKLNGNNIGISVPVFGYSGLIDGDIITCTLTCNNACATVSTVVSNSITIAVKPLITPSATITANTNNICPGSEVIFTVAPVNGGAAPSYQWKVNGINVGTNSATYTTNTLANDDLVSCEMISNAECTSNSTVVSNSIKMIVNEAVISSVSISTPGTTVCTGTNVTFTASAVNGGANSVYQWKKNGVNVGTNSSSYTDNTLQNGDVLSCVLSVDIACSSTPSVVSNSITMSVSAVLTPSVVITSSANTICSGTSISFQAEPANAGTDPIYQWKINGNNAGANSPVFTTGTLINGDVISCSLTGNSPCTSTSSATSNSITIQVNPVVTPSATITATTNNICPGSEVIFTVAPVNGGAAPSYQWKVNGINTGAGSTTYTSNLLANNDIVYCEMLGNAACASDTIVVSNSIKMSVSDPVAASVNITPPAVRICTGGNTTFTAQASNGGTGAVYTWKVNDVSVGINSAVYSSNTLANGDMVSCELTSNAACVTDQIVRSNTVIIEALTPPSIRITTSAGAICTGESKAFIATAAGAGTTPSYQWKVNGLNVGTNSLSYTANNFSNNDEVSCTMIPGTGSCSDAAVASNLEKIIINPLPNINIFPADTIVLAGSQVQLNATSSAPLNSYQWLPVAGVSNPNSLASVTIPLNFTTDYLFKAETIDGCPLTKRITIKIYQKLYIPAAFSPDQNGINDVFRIPPNVYLALKDFSIYDRYGIVLFSTTDVAKGWDGTFKGTRQPAGAYVYIIRGTDINGPVSLKGSVILLR